MKRNFMTAPLALAMAALLAACGSAPSSASASAATSAVPEATAAPTAEPTEAPATETAGLDSAVTHSTQTVSAPQPTGWSSMADTDNLPETLPLYFDLHLEGKTLQDIADLTGYPLETLQALNPDLGDGTIEDTLTVLLDDACPLPDAQERTVQIVPTDFYDSTVAEYSVPAWMDEDAAAVLGEAMDAMAHMDQSAGYWPAESTEEEGSNRYRAQEGARFTTYADYEAYIGSLFTDKAGTRFLNAEPNQYGYQTGYCSDENGALIFGAGDGGSNIFYLGCLFTDPIEQTDDVLSFGMLSVYAAEDMFDDANADKWPAAKLGYHPVRMVRESDGWRVDEGSLPTVNFLQSTVDPPTVHGAVLHE